MKIKIGRHQQGFDFAAKVLEDFQDDVVLVPEMVVEIARADVHRIRNMIGTDIVFALGIEKLEAGRDDSLSGFQVNLQ